MDLFTNRNRLTDVQNKHGLFGVWDQQIQTTIHETDKQQGLTVQPRKLYSISCINYNRKEKKIIITLKKRTTLIYLQRETVFGNCYKTECSCPPQIHKLKF